MNLRFDPKALMDRVKARRWARIIHGRGLTKAELARNAIMRAKRKQQVTT